MTVRGSWVVGRGVDRCTRLAHLSGRRPACAYARRVDLLMGKGSAAKNEPATTLLSRAAAKSMTATSPASGLAHTRPAQPWQRRRPTAGAGIEDRYGVAQRDRLQRYQDRETRPHGPRTPHEGHLRNCEPDGDARTRDHPGTRHADDHVAIAASGSPVTEGLAEDRPACLQRHDRRASRSGPTTSCPNLVLKAPPTAEQHQQSIAAEHSATTLTWAKALNTRVIDVSAAATSALTRHLRIV